MGRFTDGRPMGRLPESMLPNMAVGSILEAPYIGEDFPGHNKINHRFSELHPIWQENKPDWYVSLKHTKGVYMITDEKTGKRYVGAAYGEEGIWSRWGCYMKTATGHNDELVELIKEKGFSYAENFFRFTILEQASSRDSEQFIMHREAFWKDVMLSRNPKLGYNLN